jgi:hypothetical protein
MEEVLAEVLVGDQIRGRVEVLGEPVDGVDIGFLGPG